MAIACAAGGLGRNRHTRTVRRNPRIQEQYDMNRKPWATLAPQPRNLPADKHPHWHRTPPATTPPRWSRRAWPSSRPMAWRRPTPRSPPRVRSSSRMTSTWSSTAWTAKCLAHGANEKQVGKDPIDLKDVDGKAFVRERVELGKSKPAGLLAGLQVHQPDHQEDRAQADVPGRAPGRNPGVRRGLQAHTDTARPGLSPA